MSEYSCCHYPYTAIQIDEQGDIYFCCHPWCSSYSIGNIFKKPFSEIWNGEKAQEFRRQFLEDNYKYCNLNTCINAPDRKFKTSLIADKYPEVVALSYDRICNVECVFCRDCTPKQNLSIFDKTMEDWIPSVFKNAERVSLSGVGEALASKHTRNLIKKIAELYPNIKFDILTNGILMDEKNISELGIINNLGVIRFSFHSTKKSTYNKLVKRGNFDKVISNIKYISNLQKQGLVQQLEFRFVINTLNYKEMVSFSKMAQKHNANVTFLNLLPNDSLKGDFFKKMNIIDKSHPKHNDFAKTLKNPIFREDNIYINKELLNLEYKSLIKLIKEKFNN